MTSSIDDILEAGQHNPGARAYTNAVVVEALQIQAARIKVLEEATNWLETAMRRYVYDHEPERRITVLETYRNKVGVKPWSGSPALQGEQNDG